MRKKATIIGLFAAIVLGATVLAAGYVVDRIRNYTHLPETLYDDIVPGMSDEEVTRRLELYETAPSWDQSFGGGSNTVLSEGGDLPVTDGHYVKGWKVNERRELWVWIDRNGRSTAKFLLSTGRR